MQAIRKLLSGIVDYAGLFPPASLPMPVVVDNYGQYRDDSDSWMLARLIIPVNGLREFVQTAKLPTDSGQTPWRISALIPPADTENDGFAGALEAIDQFNEQHRQRENGLAIIDAVEVKAATVELVEKTANGIPSHIKAFLELPHNNDPQPLIEVIRNCRPNIFAKIRTGGVTPELIPAPDDVARFIDRCGHSKVGFKATAGLHHPIRGEYRLTYDEHAPIGKMYGFLNVFVAACFAFDGSCDLQMLEQILTVTDVAEFDFQSDALTWRGKRVSVDAIEHIRRDLAISFGSCSFDEPTRELRQLGMLADLTTS